MNLTEHNFEFNPSKEFGVAQEYRLVIYDSIKECFSKIVVIPIGKEVVFNQDEFDTHLFYKFKYQIKSEGKWKDFSKYKPLSIEKADENGIKYMYYHQPKSTYLIIVFQALNKIPSYNYVGTLKNIKLSKLYIKDDYGYEPTKATYYLGKNKDFSISRNVVKLIEKVRNYNNLDKRKVILTGSSKGGFAAIYHSFLGEYGYAIAGGPQLYLGKYLGENLKSTNSIKPPIFKYITGDLNESDIKWADSILANLVEKKVSKNPRKSPKMYIHVGAEEPHYREHVQPFISLLKSFNLSHKIDLDLGNYNSHEDLARYFPAFLAERIKTITYEKNN